MYTVQYINTDHKEVIITGSNRDKDIGAIFNNTTPIHIENLFISNVFLGWVKRTSAQVTVGRLQVWDYGGDAGNVRGSNLEVDKYVTYKPTPTRPYDTLLQLNGESVREALEREGVEGLYQADNLEWAYSPKHGCNVIGAYHVDAGFQAFATLPDGFTLDPTGVIKGITVHDVYVNTDGHSLQTFAFTEVNRYSNIHIGGDNFHMETAKPIGMVINQLDNSSFGCEGATCNTRMLLDARKDTSFTTRNNNIQGIGIVGASAKPLAHTVIDNNLSEAEYQAYLEIMRH